MPGYGGHEAVVDETEDAPAGMDHVKHHEFKAAHHARMAKLHHGIGKAHEMAAAHHQSMLGESQTDEGPTDEDTTTANMTQGTPFGSRGR